MSEEHSRVRQAREIMGWDELDYAGMFGVEVPELVSWESGLAEVPELVALISNLIVACGERADLLEQVFDVEQLDEEGVLILLRFLRDAVNSPIPEENLEGRLEQAIGLSVELAAERAAQQQGPESFEV